MILGFTSNDFGGQQPGSAKEIAAFCDAKYGVSFPMFQKVRVKRGDGQSPIYPVLTREDLIPTIEAKLPKSPGAGPACRASGRGSKRAARAWVSHQTR